MIEYTVCKIHGKQKAIGNYKECEICLEEYKQEQISMMEAEEFYGETLCN